MKRLVVDLDGTLTHEDDNVAYEDKRPRVEIVEHLKRYKSSGFEIVISTARNMRTFKGSIGKINAFTLPSIVDWLRRHDVPFDEIHVGKPWCGIEGFYVDDRAVRPSEFLNLSFEEITSLCEGEKRSR